MMRPLSLIAAAISYAVLSSSNVWAQDLPGLETVADIPSNGFNENIFESEGGAFFVTGAFESAVWKITEGGSVEKFATFPNHPVVLGIAGIPDGFAIGAFRRPFRTPAGTDFSNVGSEVVLLDDEGNITGTVSGEMGSVFNGMAPDGHGRALISDSQLSKIWRFDPATKSLTVWIEDEALAPASASSLGANGLRVVNGWVYVANRSQMSIYKMQMGSDGAPVGPFVLAADKLPAADDFAVGPDGSIYIPPAGQNKPLTRIFPDGKRTELIARAPAGASAIVSRNGRWVYWATGFEFGHQRLVRVAIPN